MVKELTGGYIIKYHANGLDKDPIEIDFTPPFRCLCMQYVFFSLYVNSSYVGFPKLYGKLIYWSVVNVAEGLT